ncbi:aldehyde dehydrogenase (NADP(+)) [Kineosporia rhizophila]|uniref:aldehyde dehydrogenase (NADP(+)) n=1 Tax=Kineosporia TaxID=49184 RepID=UPI001E51BB2F|nr:MULTISPECIES: aldehyde dehydrogenase (NADP(+)) [Kineosporia]MCE0536560.1 aldehyde dehydrogenase (NADP(+)) [Kineosporia rhizophila]GLY15344.1 aldehyde dehydrogenase [Kineosporia sp. NBRC 101677]
MTTDADLEQILTAAAAVPLTGPSAPAPGQRADWLDAVAAALDAAADELVPLAQSESHLPTARLNGELKRTTFQARLFATALREGTVIPAQIDPPVADWGSGPRPDLRRTVVPLGPVLVFAASNFPFAFSVFGGDTVSALAAGCPVVVKAHPGHPELSRRTAALVSQALADAGAPAGVFALIEDVEPSLSALRDSRIKAVGFTGSTAGGRALHDIALSREEPIPFYGELGSVNPVVVTAEGWSQRSAEITSGWLESLLLGSGQFCTNPGLVFVPDAQAFLADLELPAPGTMLNPALEKGFQKSVEVMAGLPGVEQVQAGPANPEGVTAKVFRSTLAEVAASPQALEEEMFGPAGLVVEYGDQAELLNVLQTLPGQLTGTVQGTSEGTEAADLVAVLSARTGRVLYNQWPTGVSVTAAQQHGGPYPATTSPLTTSVGLAAIERFQRPVAFQGLPEALLPAELRTAGPDAG